MMADQNTITLTRSLTEELFELLRSHGESNQVDFKELVDLSDPRQELKICKVIAAMSIDGGFILCGVKDDGTIANLNSEESALLDQKIVVDKVCKHFDGVGYIGVKKLFIQSSNVAIIYVEPNPECPVIAKENKDDPDRPGTYITRKGDVYVRVGSGCEPWNADAAKRLMDGHIRERKVDWQKESQDIAKQVTKAMQALTTAQGPAVSLETTTDRDSFGEVVIELIRAKDLIPIRLYLETALQRATTLYRTIASEEEARAVITDVLDRITLVISLAIRLNQKQVFDEALTVIHEIYIRTFDSTGQISTADEPSCTLLWHLIIIRVFALGGLAIRLQKWDHIRPLVLQPTAGHDADYYPNWLRHGITMASRGGLTDNRKNSDGSTTRITHILLANELVNQSPYLHPDYVTEDERILDSICQFDFAFCLIGLDANTVNEENSAFYTSFAFYHGRRIGNMATTIVKDDGIKQALIHSNDTSLAKNLKRIARAASTEGFSYNGFNRYPEPVDKFIRENLPPESDADSTPLV